MSAPDDPALEDEKQVMLREIALQPKFVRDAVDRVVARTREALAPHAGRRLSTGFVLGCGDSYCAGLALRSYLMQRTGHWIEPVEALEFPRYLVASLPPQSFAIGVSNSGTVARTIEGIRLAREHRAWTFAVTVQAASALAQTAETLVQIDAVPNIKQRADGSKLVTPGSITYAASLLGIAAAGIALGEHAGHLTAHGVQSAIVELRPRTVFLHRPADRYDRGATARRDTRTRTRAVTRGARHGLANDRGRRGR
jgi:glucosamine--fructose-6-phosphate aminotransferase (isomerizing)